MAVHLANNERDIAFQEDLATTDRDSRTLNWQHQRRNAFPLQCLCMCKQAGEREIKFAKFAGKFSGEMGSRASNSDSTGYIWVNRCRQ